MQAGIYLNNLVLSSQATPHTPIPSHPCIVSPGENAHPNNAMYKILQTDDHKDDHTTFKKIAKVDKEREQISNNEKNSFILTQLEKKTCPLRSHFSHAVCSSWT